MEAVNEIRLLASVRDKNILSYHEAFIDGNRLCIIMEYASHGDLARCIHKRKQARRPFPEETIWSYFIQVAMGLQSLHNQRVLHRDVKAANIMRSGPHVVKLGDLGISKLMKNNMTNTQIGTPHYMPPEIWRNRPYSFPSDIWALGCLLYEMASCAVPFEARSLQELRSKVLRGRCPAPPKAYSSDLHNMVRAMLQQDPSKRPTIGEILQCPAVVKRLNHLPGQEQCPDTAQTTASHMLQTIKVPRNIRLLRKNLPAPWYPSEEDDAGTRASWPRVQDQKLPPIHSQGDAPVRTSPARIRYEQRSPPSVDSKRGAPKYRASHDGHPLRPQNRAQPHPAAHQHRQVRGGRENMPPSKRNLKVDRSEDSGLGYAQRERAQREREGRAQAQRPRYLRPVDVRNKAMPVIRENMHKNERATPNYHRYH